jgi:hypothetical protein
MSRLKFRRASEQKLTPEREGPRPFGYELAGQSVKGQGSGKSRVAILVRANHSNCERFSRAVRIAGKDSGKNSVGRTRRIGTQNGFQFKQRTLLVMMCAKLYVLFVTCQAHY